MPKTIKDFFVFRRERENPQTNESIATIKEVKSIEEKNIKTNVPFMEEER